MTTDAPAQPAETPAQALLFDIASLPETARRTPSRRGRPRAARHEGLAADVVKEAISPPGAMFTAPPTPPPEVVTVTVDPVRFTNPEWRTVIDDLPDHRLAFMVVEAARALRRRLEPPDPETEWGQEPDPTLVRAMRTVVEVLAGDESLMG